MLSFSTQAYKLFSEGKTPQQVAFTLNLRESEEKKFYKEYWKLRQLHNLNMVYEETKGDTEPFLKSYRISRAKGMNASHVNNHLEITNTNLPDIHCRYERLRER